jgi:predicted peptidase
MPYAKNGFWEYLPPGYGDGVKRPLLAFFHGVGENGSGNATDLNKVLAQGPPKLINANQWPGARPFVVLSMQHAGGGCPATTEIHDFYTFAMTTYQVDPARIYITGLSCGAHGAWSYLGQYKGEQVVAGVLIAGDSNRGYNTAGCSLLTTVSIWDFHGTADSAEPFSVDSAGMMKFLACPMPHQEVKFTPIQGANHEPSWTVTYDLTGGNDIYAWLLSKTR